jgi:Delta7-sterol 5-desaturase
MELVATIRDLEAMALRQPAVGFAVIASINALIFLLSIAAFALVKTEFGQRKLVFRLPFAKGQIKSEIRTQAIHWVVDCGVFWFVLKFELIKNIGGSVTLTFIAALIGFEFWFYGLHRAMHTKRLYFIHKHHHIARVISPFSGFTSSIAERILLDVGNYLPIVILSHFMPVSIIGLTLQYFLIMVISIYVHTNLEFYPKWWKDSPLSKWLSTSSHHAIHHARYLGNYGFFTNFLDRWLKTEFADSGAIQRKAAEGEGLTSLHARIDKNISSSDAETPKLKKIS